jgi:hypothetical protein
MRQLGRALTAAHEQEIYHRDLKPENIMLKPLGEGEEQVIVIDFGIAKVKQSQVADSTGSLTIAGTLPYMAPEQLKGTVSASSDIYALGMIAYEMVTGRCPFTLDATELLAKWRQLEELQKAGVKVKPKDLRPSLPEAAQAVILKALSFDPKDRYARAREFGDQLARAFDGGPTVVIPPVSWYSWLANYVKTSWTKLKQTSWYVKCALVIVLLAMLGAAFTAYYYWKSPPEREEMLIDYGIWPERYLDPLLDYFDLTPDHKPDSDRWDYPEGQWEMVPGEGSEIDAMSGALLVKGMEMGVLKNFGSPVSSGKSSL